SGTNAAKFVFAFGSHCLRQIDQTHAGNLGHEYLAALHAIHRAKDEVDALLESQPEARHSGVGESQHSCFAHFIEQRSDAAAATDDIAVAHDGEFCFGRAGVGIGGDEKFVRAKFGGTVEIHRVGCFVGAQGNHFLDAAVDSCIEDVCRADDV